MKNYQHEISTWSKEDLQKEITRLKAYDTNYTGTLLKNLKLKELNKELNKR